MEKVYKEITITEGEEYYLPNRHSLFVITRVTEELVFGRVVNIGEKDIRLPLHELLEAVKIGDSIGSKTFKVDVTPEPTYKSTQDTSYELD